jgi:hypothetical protein
LALRVGVRRRIRREAVTGKSLPECLVIRQYGQRSTVQSADADVSDNAQSLELVDRRQNLHLRYHPAPDYAYLRPVAHPILFEPSG